MAYLPLSSVWVGLFAVAACAADFDVRKFGATPNDGRSDTIELQATIDAAAASGGGRVVLPAGKFDSGALFLKANVELHLEQDAVLAGSQDIADFPRRRTRIEGHFEEWRPALVNASGLAGVRITGAGMLDGQGKPYWTAFWKRRAENPKCTNLEVERPRLMFLENCDGVRIEGITLKDSGFWNLHLYNCRNVQLTGLSITAPHGDPPQIVGQTQPWDEVSINRAPSSDAIDVDSCQNVRITKCRISVGDDCIALKGSKGPLAMSDTSSPPVENILVEDCAFESGHGALTCGSEATLIRNVVVRNCTVGAAVPLVRLKLRPDTPQRYENLLFEHITLDNAQALFDVKPWTQFFDLQGHPPQLSHVRGVIVRDVQGSVRSLGELRGNAGDTLAGIVLERINLTAESPKLSIAESTPLEILEVTVNEVPFQLPINE